MAAQASPAAHAQTKLLTAPNNECSGRATPEGGQPMSTHHRGAGRGLRGGGGVGGVQTKGGSPV